MSYQQIISMEPGKRGGRACIRHMRIAVADVLGWLAAGQDADFAEMAALPGFPPKVIWLRAGNQPTVEIVALLGRHAELIVAFGNHGDASCPEIY